MVKLNQYFSFSNNPLVSLSIFSPSFASPSSAIPPSSISSIFPSSPSTLATSSILAITPSYAAITKADPSTISPSSASS